MVTSSKTNCERLLSKFQLIRLNAGFWLQDEELLLLMQRQIEQVLAANEELQIFLTWVSQKSCTVTTHYKPVIVRAFYFDLALARILGLVGGTLDLARSFDSTLTRNLERPLALDLALDRVLGLNRVIALSQNPQQVFDVVLDRAIGHARFLDPKLALALLQLKSLPEVAPARRIEGRDVGTGNPSPVNPVSVAPTPTARTIKGSMRSTPTSSSTQERELKGLPDLGRDAKKFKQWWSSHGEAWTEQLRAVMIQYRNLGHNWQFNHQQRGVFKEYYSLNCWLVDCLNSSCYMDGQIRAEIESSLLLPLLSDTTKNLSVFKLNAGIIGKV